MAANLLAAGYELVVHSRGRGPVAELERLGAGSQPTPARVAAASDVVVTMLPDSPDVRAVVAGPDGVLEGAREGALVVDMSTISPVVAVELHGLARERGVAFVDAPVSGADVGAREGTLSIMAGGEGRDVERARPLLDVLGGRVVHAGPPGAGQVVKACNQMVVAASLASLSEALVLASKAGIDPEVLLDALSAGLAGSRVIDVKRERLLAREFEPGFKAELHLKDLRIAFEATQRHEVAAPLAAVATQLMTALVAAGHGADDHSSLLLELERLSSAAGAGGGAR
jgi:2-hydroxy-3-oxopropionate reductase